MPCPSLAAGSESINRKPGVLALSLERCLLADALYMPYMPPAYLPTGDRPTHPPLIRLLITDYKVY